MIYFLPFVDFAIGYIFTYKNTNVKCCWSYIKPILIQFSNRVSEISFLRSKQVESSDIVDIFNVTTILILFLKENWEKNISAFYSRHIGVILL